MAFRTTATGTARPTRPPADLSCDSTLSLLRECERQLLADERGCRAHSQPIRPLILLGQRQPRTDPLVAREQLAQEFRAVALAAAVQQDDMRGKFSTRAHGAVEDPANRVERLLVRQMARAV